MAEYITMEGKGVQDTRMLSPILPLTTSVAVNFVFWDSSLCLWVLQFVFVNIVNYNRSVKGRKHELSCTFKEYFPHGARF